MSEITGLFPERGWLDRLDKAASRPIFHAVLPPAGEVLLTIPGAWFGCPVYAICLTPVILAATADQQSSFRAGVGGLAACGAVAWVKLYREGCMTKAYTSLGVQYLLLLPSLAFGVASLGCKEGLAATTLYVCSWHVTQISVEIMKGLSWRLRPVHALKEELQSVPRVVTELAAIVQQPSQANLSFPSGDAAGSAVFAAALLLKVGAHPGYAIAATVLGSVARVYFHCHHLLDVLVGQAIGFGMTYAISQYQPLAYGHMLLSQLLLGGLWKPVQRLKPKGGTRQDLHLPSNDGSSETGVDPER